MARKRNRYQQLERTVTAVLIVDALFFILYLITAWIGSTVWKVITAVLTIGIALLLLVFLYLNQEYKRRRSFWMVLCAGAILVCIMVSLLLGFPCPAPTSDKVELAAILPSLMQL